MRLIKISLAFSMFITATTASAQLKDPMTRDEDISGTSVDVSVEQRNDGFYEYVYTISAPESNKGEALSFSIDLSCNKSFEAVAFPEAQDPDAQNLSEDGHHAPVQVYGTYGQAVMPAVSVVNEGTWLIGARPATTITGARILSPMPPTDRQWSMSPSMDTEGWDYSPYDEDDPTVPWIEDFTVFGMAKGPGCEAAPSSKRFPGTTREPAKVNELLTYAKPMRDRWHAEEGEGSVTFDIFYSDRIDPATFKVQPGWARNAFHPEPGTHEEVVLPLKHPAVNRFTFQVHPQGEGKRRKDDPLHHSVKDLDEFEIRRDTKRGNGR
jgi:hypothetical protein